MSNKYIFPCSTREDYPLLIVFEMIGIDVDIPKNTDFQIIYSSLKDFLEIESFQFSENVLEIYSWTLPEAVVAIKPKREVLWSRDWFESN